MFFVFLANVFSKLEDFNVRSIVAGNWSTSSNGEFHVMYFVPVKGYGHFQALLNDRFLDIWVLSKTNARVCYEGLNFTLQFEQSNTTHPFASAIMNDQLLVDVVLLTKNALRIAIVNRETGDITNWSVIRPKLATVTAKDVAIVVGFMAMSAYLARKIAHLLCWPLRT